MVLLVKVSGMGESGSTMISMLILVHSGTMSGVFFVVWWFTMFQMALVLCGTAKEAKAGLLGMVEVVGASRMGAGGPFCWRGCGGGA